MATMSSIRDPRSSEGYKPRFELWGNVFLHQAYANVVNSLVSFEVTTESSQGRMLTEVRIPMDRLIWNIKLLRAQILEEWRVKDEYIKDINIDWDEELMPEDKDGTFVFNKITPDEYFHKLVQVLYKRGLLKFKKQRSLGGPPQEQ